MSATCQGAGEVRLKTDTGLVRLATAATMGGAGGPRMDPFIYE